MNTNEIIIKLLWSDYIGLVQSGVPVYFTFTSDAIEDLLNDNEIAFDNAHDFINKCARDFLYVNGEYVYLKPNALTPNKSGFSSAILIVCQQVLVVEEMVRNDIHSENAYFPHLRKNISSELGEFSQNPFFYQEFESVWKTLSREMYLINQNHNCVTFSFDEVKGMNKARRFPLSQALLTKEDAVRLIDTIGQSVLREESEERIFKNVVANRSSLSNRGKNITKHPWMRHALINQLRSLSKSVGELNLIREAIDKKTKDVSKLRLEVYSDSSDWLNVEYVVNIFDEFGGIVRDSEVVNSYFKLKVESNSYVVLVPKLKGDGWIYAGSEYYPKLGDELIILYEPDPQGSVFSLISSYFKLAREDVTENRFSRSKNYHFIKLALDLNFDKNIYIQNGRIYVPDKTVGEKQIQFIGGIAVNKSNDRFSSLHLPSGVIVSGKEYVLEGRMKINGKYYLYEEFRKNICSINVEDTYDIELDGGIRFNLKVAPRYGEPIEGVYYPPFSHRLLPLSTFSKNIPFSVSSSNIGLESYQTYQEIYEAKSRSDFIYISKRLGQLQK